MTIPTSVISAASLVGGYLVARETEIRPLGGAVLAAGAVANVRTWNRVAGPGVAGTLLAIYLGGFGASHPLAKKLGAWPSVFTVAGISAAASWVLADRRELDR